ncbi:pleckstrin homology domain-containing family A member 8 isoform X1 [Antechinus flavipes]|uniref:pleckstrin homology domain-containing family A member 8 isoform X1 n=1 Tax=Antechinus flavipes TaxID=38775 RepID=UPI00223673CF|nr:pleckstrin homology domain-containing family A member 8 isoform X1 [Antechinus flavipes]XP_051856382.1 pleckstrin homology domain-containing family A member 8 isoform X1 [Antechinus flavipes]
MEGVLYKWTNYLSGWQPRWFLLCGGILSYYDSPEDAWKGCKGSIQMAVCEIQVHSADNTRMDLIIPGEQYFYLKARNVAERQRWLVALGSAKACLTDSRAQKEREFTENTETLKTKMSELRLYCDLLVQQVNRTKEAAAAGVGDAKEGIDVGTLLQSTCNTFLKTLEECMQIANAAFTSELLYRTPPGSPRLAVLKPSKTKLPILPIPSVLDRQTELNSCENGSLNTEISDSEETLIKNESPLYMKPTEKGNSLSTKENTEDHLTVQSGDVKDDGERDTETPHGSDVEPPPESPMGTNPGGDSLGARAEEEEEEVEEEDEDEEEEEEEVQTFFSTMNTSFSDIDLLEDGGIPTEAFLESCYAIVPVLDKLGPTVFAPVKMDLVGNIKKVNQKYITNKEDFSTLQKIVLHEVSAGVAQVRNSATEALLWLKRGLKFLKGFLTEVKNGEKDVQRALNSAYGRTLRQHHGWVVRGVFALALRAAPSYEDFVEALSIREGDHHKEAFGLGMQRDLNLYLPAMEKQLDILDALYEAHGLESDEVV